MTNIEKVDELLKGYSYKNELGEEIDWTEGQKQIMAPIIGLGAGGKKYVQVETPTRYGKSASVAAALNMRCTKQEKWAIVAGTADKAQIIMDYFIDYALENPVSRELLRTEVALDKLKQDKSRRHLTNRVGFEVQVFSADSKNKQNTGNAIMGFGAPFVILDEAALVDDLIESKIFRMIAGFSTTKHVYIKIGNPFYRNHFWKSHNDPDFHLIWIDYLQGIAEGRYTREYIEKARTKPNFDVLYEVKFPPPDAVDDKGWSNLLNEEDIEAVMVDSSHAFGFVKVGCDPAGEGTNFNTAVVRYRNYAYILFKERLLDQFQFTERMMAFKEELKIKEQPLPMGYYVDRVGVGEGHYQTMRRDLENVVGVNVGRKPTNEEEFVNLRAEAYWRLAKDIKEKRVKLQRSEDWLQLAKVKYRTRLEGRRGKIEIMSKEEMLRNGVESPDVADALMLTYTSLDPFDTITLDMPDQETSFDKFDVFGNI